MKNLFKKMMLVAVAAMAFVACSQDNDEINATVKKTDVVFNLSIEDVTRAYFGEEQGSGSDTSFPSYWSGNESVRLVAYDSSDAVVAKAWGSIEAEGQQARQGRVRATFEGPLTGVEKVRAYVGSWSYNEPGVLELAQEQYMDKEGTVASNAHTMSAEAEWDGVAQSIDLNFKHAVAYGRMQIKSIVGIDDVNDVTITKAIVKVDEAEYQVSLNSDFDTKYIWFACEADEDIETLDIEVKASNGSSYVKTINMAAAANPLKFRTGEVSKFAVSDLVEKGAVYTSATMVQQYSTNDVMVSFTGDGLEEMQINFYGAAMNSGSLYVGTFTIGNGLYDGYCFYGDTQLDTITVVSTFENGVYKLVFSNLKDNNGNAVVEGDLTFTGLISGLTPVDLRTQLATPSNVKSSVDGKTITLSWDPVTGADGYRVKLYSPYEEYFEEIVTTNEYVYEAQLYSKQYSFTIMSYASDTNAQNRSSEDAYAYVTTGKDPSIWADVVATNIVWDSANGAFKMTGEVVSGTAWGHSSDYIRIHMNESDRPGNNSIKVGQYTGCGGTSPQQGQFGARLSLYWGTVTYPSAIGSASTLDVTYDEVVGYTIVLTHNNVTYGYKGMPTGWEAPSEGGESGGDEPVNPEPEPEPEPGVADGTSIAKAYTFTSYSTYKDAGYPVMCLAGAENGATFNFESNSTNGFPTGMHKFNDGAWYPAVCEYKINGEAQTVDFVNSVIWVEGDNTNGYTVEYIYIVTEDGNGIYYKYDGKFYM